MSYVDHVGDLYEVDDTMDSIVIPIVEHTFRGGRSLNVTGYPEPVIKAGHVIIMQNSNEECKPMPLIISEETNKPIGYDSLPAGHSYIGLLRASILRSKAFAAIVTAGQANPAVLPFSLEPIIEDFIEAVPLIEFKED